MSSAIQPMTITFGQRLQVITLRVLMSSFKLFSLFRKTPEAPGDITSHQYGDHRDETLEVISRKAGSPERDAVVYVHGGGWIAGKKEIYTSDLFFLAEQGHPVFNIEYPMAPENTHPGILRSLLRALEWIRENHPECETVHFMGDSAGGNLATMLGVLSSNPELIRDIDGDALPRLAVSCSSFVSIYGVLDRLSWIRNKFPGSTAMLASYGGTAAFEEEVSQDLAITPMDLKFDSLPPCYLTAGTEDQLCESTEIFAKRVEGSSNEVVTRIFDGEAHGFFNLSWRPASQQLRSDIVEFIARHDSSTSAGAN